MCLLLMTPLREYLLVARTIASWIHADHSGTIQLANTADHGIDVPAQTAVGFICPVKDATPLTTGSVTRDGSSLAHARTEL